MFSLSATRLPVAFGLLSLLLLSGCMNPYMYYGYPYSQPMYAPPQMLNQNAPGTLVIPESGGAPYEPGRNTYDTDPDDDFEQSDEDSRFFQPDDGAPLPRDLNKQRFENDLGGPTTYIQPAAESAQIQQVSHVEIPDEYGFDTAGYRWLRGKLHYVPERGAWLVNYSLAANDRYRGSLILDVAPDQLGSLKDGDSVDVHGVVSPNTDQQGTALYHVEMIRPMATRIAM